MRIIGGYSLHIDGEVHANSRHLQRVQKDPELACFMSFMGFSRLSKKRFHL
jgi:hypothetical protein